MGILRQRKNPTFDVASNMESCVGKVLSPAQPCTVAEVWRLLPSDHLPSVRDENVLRLLRDVDEHWEQVDEGRSLTELRATMPDIAAGMIVSNNKHVWLGNVSLDELRDWIQDVDRTVRARAEAAGSPLLKPDDPLP